MSVDFGRHAIMEDTTFDWLDNYPLNYGTPEVPASSSPRASQGSPAVEQADQPSGEHALPLLRLSGWKSESNMTRITPYVSTMTFGGRSPNVRILELGMFVQIQIPISSWL